MFKYKLKLNVCERESVCFVHVCVCVYTRWISGSANSIL